MKRARIEELKVSRAPGGYQEALCHLEAAHLRLDEVGERHKPEAVEVRVALLAKERDDARNAALVELQKVVDELEKTDIRESRKLQDAVNKALGAELSITVKKVTP